MNAIRILSCIFVASAAALGASKQAAAAPVTVACSTAIDDYFSGRLPGGWLDVIGTRVTMRGWLGFSSVTMRDGYSASTPPNTPAFAASRMFVASRGAAQYNGVFTEVFTDRGNNDVDRTEFWVSRSGTLWLRSITWNGSWQQVQGVACYRGPQSQTIMTGWIDFPGFGPDFYMFAMQGDVLL